MKSHQEPREGASSVYLKLALLGPFFERLLQPLELGEHEISVKAEVTMAGSVTNSKRIAGKFKLPVILTIQNLKLDVRQQEMVRRAYEATKEACHGSDWVPVSTFGSNLFTMFHNTFRKGNASLTDLISANLDVFEFKEDPAGAPGHQPMAKIRLK